MAEKLTPANQREQEFREKLINVLDEISNTLAGINTSLKSIDVQLDNHTENQVAAIEHQEKHLSLMKEGLKLSERMLEGQEKMTAAAIKLDQIGNQVQDELAKMSLTEDDI